MQHHDRITETELEIWVKLQDIYIHIYICIYIYNKVKNKRKPKYRQLKLLSVLHLSGHNTYLEWTILEFPI